MERVRWIEVKGKKIIYIDYTGLKELEEMFAVLDECVKIVKTLPGNYLSLTNFTDSVASSEFMDRLKKEGKSVFEQKTGKGASVGITGLKLILFQAYLRFTGSKNRKLFNTEREAIDWLVS